MSVLSFLSILVVEGCKEQRNGMAYYYRTLIYWCLFLFKRFILKSPVNIHVFSSFCIFVSSGIKYWLLKRLIFIFGCLQMKSQIMFLLFGKINSIKVDSNLRSSLIRRFRLCLKVKLSERKKPIPSWELSVSLK